MLEMTPAELYALASADPPAATAVATVALMDATVSLKDATVALVEVSNNHVLVSLIIGVGTLLIGLAQVAVVWHGINEMAKATKIRAADQDQRHQEAMTSLRALIKQSRPDRRAVRRASP